MRSVSVILVCLLALLPACKEDKPVATPVARANRSQPAAPQASVFAPAVPPTQGVSSSPEPTPDEMMRLVVANIKADVDRNLPAMRARTGRNLPGLQAVTQFEKRTCRPVALPIPGVKCTFRMTFKLNNEQKTITHIGFFARDYEGRWIFRP